MSTANHLSCSRGMLLVGLAAVAFWISYQPWQPSIAAPTCDVNCTAINCFKNFSSGNFYMLDNKAVCNFWFVSTAGCLPSGCDCVNEKNTFPCHQTKTGTVVCAPIQTNDGQATCGDPIGTSFNTTCCQGCSPKAGG